MGLLVKIVMTLLVRDAESILRDNLEFHLRQGVDFFIITDNLSSDATVSIIEEYVRKGVAEAFFESDDVFAQGRWVTRMARRANECGADWVVNSDDDEFWISSEGTLQDVLAAKPDTCQALLVNRQNFPPVCCSPESWFGDAMRFREQRSYNALGRPLPPKVCHRSFADIEVMQGNHKVARAGLPLAAEPCASIRIAHYPVRDYASFENRIAKGGAAYARNTELDPGVGATWRFLYELWRAGGLRAWYDQRVLTSDRTVEGLANGTLVEDTTLANTLRRTTSP
jgi:hypothetical protein